jgi:hypothetical protein
MDVGGDMTGAHKVHGSTHRTGGRMKSAVLENMNMNYSQTNELTQDVEIRAPRAVRVVRTVRIGLPAIAMASTLRTDTSMTKSKESSLQIAEFAVNHPILAMLVLGLISLIGSICIFALPIGWLPF